MTSSDLVHTNTISRSSLRYPENVAFLPSGHLVGVDLYNAVHVVDITRTYVTIIPRPPGVYTVHAVAVWPDGSMALMACIISPESYSIYIFHLVN